MGFNPSGKFEGNSGSSKTVSSQTVQSSRALINQIRGTAVANTLNSGIPKHVMRVSASMARASSGTTSAIKVLFHRDPSDTSFTKALVFVRGYQGNSSPVQVASGTASPITVVLNNTGETLSFHVQASGNAGDAPFAGCPTTGATLPLSTNGGYGSTTVINPPPPAYNINAQFTSLNAWGDTATNANSRFQQPSLGAQSSAVRVSLDTPVTVRKATLNIQTAFASSFVVVAIYTADGTSKLIDFGASAFNSTTTGVKTVTLGTPVTLQPGAYLVGFTTNSGSNSGPLGVGQTPLAGVTLPNGVTGILNANAKRYVYCANGLSGSSMPASLGALTSPTSDSQNFEIPYILFE